MPDDAAQPDYPADGRVPILRGERIYLRAGERADIPLFVRWFNDLRTTRTLIFLGPMGTVSEEAWFTTMSEHQGNDRWFFVICRLEDDRPVGAIDLHAVDYRNGSTSLGIVIGDPDDTGHGYGSDALRTLLTFGFDQHLGLAARIAVDGMLDLMEREHGLSREDALGFASVVVDLRVTQVVNQVLGVHAVLRDDAFL